MAAFPQMLVTPRGNVGEGATKSWRKPLLDIVNNL